MLQSLLNVLHFAVQERAVIASTKVRCRFLDGAVKRFANRLKQLGEDPARLLHPSKSD